MAWANHPEQTTAMRFALAAGLLIALVPMHASASATPTSGQCTAAVADETRIACLQDQFDRNDRVLNIVYKQALARPGGGMMLRKAQRAWLRSTKALCEAAGSEFAQDSAVQVAVEDCYNRKTIERIAYLKRVRSRH